MFVSLTDLADELTTLAAHINAATCRWLSLLAEFDAREGWGVEGCKTCAHWVSWKCSMDPGAAREHVRVARRLPALPLVRDAFAAGELSYSKVRALTRIEHVDDEAELVTLARHATASQLERLVRGYRSVVAVELGTPRKDARTLSWHHDDDGSLVLRGRLPAEEGALVVAALEAARERLAAERGVAPTGPSASRDGQAADRPTNADALLALTEHTLDDVTRGGSSADRYQVVVHVDASSLTQAGDQDGRAELDTGVPLPRQVARRLACDASLVRVVEQDGRPLTVGRRTRSIPPALRRALRSRDGDCAFPGCTSTRHVDAHHIEHWSDGGRTDLDNLVHLCRHHHRLVHEGGYRIERRHAGVIFFAPSGQRLATVPRPPRGDCPTLLADHERRHVRVSAETVVPLSHDPMDLDMAVDAMLAIAPPRRE